MADGNGTPPEGAAPQLNVLAQYTKDLSFENPNAPGSLAPQAQQPNINIQINDVASGQPVLNKSVDIRGNTDASWERGIRYMVRSMEEKGQGNR